MKDGHTTVDSLMTVAVAPSPYEDIRQQVAARTGETPDRIRLVEMQPPSGIFDWTCCSRQACSWM